LTPPVMFFVPQTCQALSALQALAHSHSFYLGMLSLDLCMAGLFTQ
jgi:hypothetical protein